MLTFRICLFVITQSALPGLFPGRSGRFHDGLGSSSEPSRHGASSLCLREGSTGYAYLTAAFWLRSCVIPQDPHRQYRSRLSFALTTPQEEQVLLDG